jgi:hypothetical protein
MSNNDSGSFVIFHGLHLSKGQSPKKINQKFLLTYC